ncbi:MAG TPA: flagellar basal-body MS-ring/collar protein FliF [Rhizomicrobium sp.]|nr:flagellar basal-body MS-ring/collar protein FliF [Rhizomicrobium sp.]
MPSIIKAIGAARFGVMAGIAAALTAFFLYVAGVISEPPKTILYAGLDPRDAASVTAKLDAMQVPYDAKGDGGTILVPADQVTKLRMSLAAQNLPAAGVGYEIFDKSDAFGTTAFVQNINSLRALEGELARSIQTIDGIDAARVHLVVPERQIFSHDQQTPSASIVLRTNGSLDHGQVQAIQHLVAAAVTGLNPERVAIVDDKGTLLAGGDEKTGSAATTADQEQHTTDVEDRMRQRIESIVASIVGAGHVRVQVAADLNYNQSSETSEIFDPDSKVVRSLQTVEQNANEVNGSGNANAVSVANAVPNAQAPAAPAADGGRKSDSGRTEETTNYEINKTVRTSTVAGGDIKRISVAVAVDGTSVTDANGKTTYTPRSKQELAQIESLVRSAIGFDKKRGDQVEVVNMPFARLDAGPITPAPEPFLGLDGAYWFKIIEAALLCITALLIGFFVARPLIARMFAPLSMNAGALPAPVMGQLPAPSHASQPQQQASGEATALLAAPKESMIDIQRIEGQVRESSVRKVGEVVQSHPEEALAILRTWLHQPV